MKGYRSIYLTILLYLQFYFTTLPFTFPLNIVPFFTFYQPPFLFCSSVYVFICVWLGVGLEGKDHARSISYLLQTKVHLAERRARAR